MKTLPSLSRFKRMSIRRRTEVFLAWARTQPKRKTYPCNHLVGCALHQFGQAIAGADCIRGVSRKFRLRKEGLVEVLPYEGCEVVIPVHTDHPTFGSLVKRLEAHLATHPQDAVSPKGEHGTEAA